MNTDKDKFAYTATITIANPHHNHQEMAESVNFPLYSAVPMQPFHSEAT
ncbi:TPA: hypothetical protein ACGQ6T_004605 [Escherichia coli]